LQLPEDKVRKTLEAVENVRARAVIGGPAPVELKRVIDHRQRRIRDEEGRLENRRMKLEQEQKTLEGEAKILSTSS